MAPACGVQKAARMVSAVAAKNDSYWRPRGEDATRPETPPAGGFVRGAIAPSGPSPHALAALAEVKALAAPVGFPHAPGLSPEARQRLAQEAGLRMAAMADALGPGDGEPRPGSSLVTRRAQLEAERLARFAAKIGEPFAATPPAPVKAPDEPPAPTMSADEFARRRDELLEKLAKLDENGSVVMHSSSDLDACGSGG